MPKNVRKKDGLNPDEVFNYEVLAVSEWCKRHGGAVSSTAADYLMNNDIIDFVRPVGGRFRYIVMTDKTKSYSPNPSPRRTSKESF